MKKINYDKNSTISKSIYMIYANSQTGKMPEEIIDNIEKIKKYNPGWSLIIFSDDEINQFLYEQCDKEIIQAFHSISPEYGAARADLFRYLILYYRGGVYFDVKSSINKPLDDLVGDRTKFIVAQWDNDSGEYHEGWGIQKELSHINGGAYIQWFIAAPKGSELLYAVIKKVLKEIKNYNPFVHGVGRQGTIRVTGPIAFTLAIEPMLDEKNHLYYRKFPDAGLVYSIYEELGLKGGHRSLFQKHFSMQRSPLIIRYNIYNVLWNVKCLISRVQEKVARLKI